MTLNVSVVTPRFIAVATDRRLTAGKLVVGERSCKLIQFDCGAARGIITYNGIGRSTSGETPNDWVADAMLAGPCDIRSFCERIKVIAEPRIRALAPQFDNNPRHTFVIAAYDRGTPVLGLLSNYESLGEGPDAEVARAALTLEMTAANSPTSYYALVTGAANLLKRNSTAALRHALLHQASEQDVLKKMTKIIRDVAYRDRAQGSVGTSVLTSILQPYSGFEGGSSVVGGSIIQENGDYLTIGSQFRNIWVAGLKEGQEMPPGYGPGLGQLPEVGCSFCGNPVPMGYRKCPSCDGLVY